MKSKLVYFLSMTLIITSCSKDLTESREYNDEVSAKVKNRLEELGFNTSSVEKTEIMLPNGNYRFGYRVENDLIVDASGLLTNNTEKNVKLHLPNVKDSLHAELEKMLIEEMKKRANNEVDKNLSDKYLKNNNIENIQAQYYNNSLFNISGSSRNITIAFDSSSIISVSVFVQQSQEIINAMAEYNYHYLNSGLKFQFSVANNPSSADILFHQGSSSSPGAVTWVSTSGDDIIEANIYLNVGLNVSNIKNNWSPGISTSTAINNIKRVIGHELGHAVGLAHSSGGPNHVPGTPTYTQSNSIMLASATPRAFGSHPFFNTYDITALLYIY